MQECLKQLRTRELDPGHAAAWSLPGGTTLAHFVREAEAVQCVDRCVELVAVLGKQVSEVHATLKQADEEIAGEARKQVDEEQAIERALAAGVEHARAPLDDAKAFCEFASEQVIRLEAALSPEAAAGVAEGGGGGEINWGEFLNATQGVYAEGKGKLDALRELDSRQQAQVEDGWRSKVLTSCLFMCI